MEINYYIYAEPEILPLLVKENKVVSVAKNYEYETCLTIQCGPWRSNYYHV